MSYDPNMATLDDIFAEEEARLRAEADERDRIDALPENAARIQAKRDAEVKREIAQGLRDGAGEWIGAPEAPEPEEDEDEDDEPEDEDEAG